MEDDMTDAERNLIEMCRNGEVETVNTLLEEGNLAVEVTRADGGLMVAVSSGHSSVALSLIAKGAPITPTDGYLPLLDSANDPCTMNVHFTILRDILGISVGRPGEVNGWNDGYLAVHRLLYKAEKGSSIPQRIHIKDICSKSLDVPDRMGVTVTECLQEGIRFHRDELKTFGPYPEHYEILDGLRPDDDCIDDMRLIKTNYTVDPQEEFSQPHQAHMPHQAHVPGFQLQREQKYFTPSVLSSANHAHIPQTSPLYVPCEPNIQILPQPIILQNPCAFPQHMRSTSLIRKLTSRSKPSLTPLSVLEPHVPMIQEDLLFPIIKGQFASRLSKRKNIKRERTLRKLRLDLCLTCQTLSWEQDVPVSTVELIEGLALEPGYVKDRVGWDCKKIISHILDSHGFGLIRDTDITRDIHHDVHMLMCRIANHMNTTDPILQMYASLKGSTGECTKHGLVDEYDYNLYIGGMEGIYEVEEYDTLGEEERDEEENEVRFKLKAGYVATRWSSFCKDGMYFKPQVIFHYLHVLMYKALADPCTWTDLRLLWKPFGVNKIHLIWRGSRFPGMVIKFDVMYCVWAENYWPTFARNTCTLIGTMKRAWSCCILLREYGWVSTPCETELVIMQHIPLPARLAYILCKILASLMQWEDGRHKVKSYDLKNALMYKMNESTEFDGLVQNLDRPRQCDSLELPLTFPDILSDETLTECIRWVHHITAHLGRLGVGKPYFFGFSTRRNDMKELDRFKSMINMMLCIPLEDSA